MLIWFWLQNQYFTSLENALSISNNHQSPWEPHTPATLTLAGTTSYLCCSAPLKNAWATTSHSILTATFTLMPRSVLELSASFNTRRVKFTAFTASVLERTPLVQPAPAKLVNEITPDIFN